MATDGIVVKSGGIVVAEEGTPCCCEEPLPEGCYPCGGIETPSQVTVSIFNSVECTGNQKHGNPDGTYCLDWGVPSAMYPSATCLWGPGEWEYTADETTDFPGTYMGQFHFGLFPGGLYMVVFDHEGDPNPIPSYATGNIRSGSCDGSTWSGTLRTPSNVPITVCVDGSIKYFFHSAEADVTPGC